MAIYTVHSRSGEAPDKAIFVRDGFSFGAFFLGIVWALWNRMWLVAAALLLIAGVIAAAGDVFGVPDTILVLSNLAVALIFGFEARDLQRRSLAASGKPEVGIAAGARREEAELRYFMEHPSPRQPAAAVAAGFAPRGPQHDTLGLFGNM